MKGKGEKQPFKGDISLPGDKSISHRSLLFPSIATGKSRIKNLLDSEDVKMTMGLVRAAGVHVERGDGEWILEGKGLRSFREPRDVINAGNSGTTIRIGAGFLSSIDGLSVVTGDRYLRKRPMERVSVPLSMMGASVWGREGGRFPPLVIRGGGLDPINYDMPHASAQVKSSILAAAASCGIAVSVGEPVPSRDHTERMIISMGGTISRSGKWLTYSPSSRLDPVDISVPGDFSSAAFFIVGALTTAKSEVAIRGVLLNPLRCGLLAVLSRMGADIEMEGVHMESGEEVGDLIIRHSSLKGTEVGAEEIPSMIDEIPILCVAASFASGRTEIRGAGELRVKESDRIKAMVGGLSKLGVKVEELADGMVIEGGEGGHREGSVSSFGDHRVAMALEIFSRAAGVSVDIDDTDCIATSFPGFSNTLEELSR